MTAKDALEFIIDNYNSVQENGQTDLILKFTDTPRLDEDGKYKVGVSVVGRFGHFCAVYKELPEWGNSWLETDRVMAIELCCSIVLHKLLSNTWAMASHFFDAAFLPEAERFVK